MKKTWSPTADLLIKNVTVYTVDLTVEEIKKGKTDFTIIKNGYVASKDGKTIAVGSGLDESLVGVETVVIDGQENILIPGLIDSHMHAMFAGIELMNVNLKNASSKDEMIDLLKEKEAVTPKGEWIKGSEWNELVWDVKESPSKDDLDKVTAENPIVCSRLCHHVCVVNSKALELAGITKETPNPDGGIIGRDEDGNPNGLLYEPAAMGLVESIIPELTEDLRILGIEEMGKVLSAAGITSCIDANLAPDDMKAYLKAYNKGRLSYRANLMFYLDKATGDIPYHLNRIKEMPTVTGFGNEMIKINGIKILFDGIPATGTAAMRKPYEHIPETSGYTTITEEEMIEVAKLGAEYNWQIGVHSCGDKSADIAIQAFIEAYKVNKNDARHYIIHHAVMQSDQIPLMKAYNIPITVQPTINSLMGEQSIIGAEMAGRYMQYKTFIDGGVLVAGSTDCPVVDCNPFLGMHSAITRLSAADGVVWSPEQVLTPAQALIMWTKSSAYFSHDDDKMGSIEVGNLADYVLIDTPLLDIEPEKIRHTTVLKTILDGRIVYDALNTEV
ncbi:MAG: amidohydrolase [Acetobacterium woodii]|nr:amidohydrolase [Acetobacterium woodii]